MSLGNQKDEENLENPRSSGGARVEIEGDSQNGADT